MNIFREIAIGEGFSLGGNWYVKKSARTAEMVRSRGHNGKAWFLTGPAAPKGKRFYVWGHELVNREKAWFLYMFDQEAAKEGKAS